MSDGGNVLVTGGAGYIGSHTCKRLAECGYYPIVFDNLGQGSRNFVRWGPLEVGDLRNRGAILDLLKRYRPIAIIHCAASAYVGESVESPQTYYLNNIIGTLHLLESALQADNVPIVFSSSCAVYGVPKQFPIRETTPTDPINPYGRTKLVIENVLADYAHAYGLESISLRYFNAAGADPAGEIGERHDPETHLIPLTLEVAAGERPHISIYGDDYKTNDGTCIRDYLHVWDIALAHVMALEHLRDIGPLPPINLGTGKGYSVREVVQMVGNVTRRSIPTLVEPRRVGDPACLVAALGLAEESLKWKARVSDLRTIVRDAWAWHRKVEQGEATLSRKESDDPIA